MYKCKLSSLRLMLRHTTIENSALQDTGSGHTPTNGAVCERLAMASSPTLYGGQIFTQNSTFYAPHE